MSRLHPIGQIDHIRLTSTWFNLKPKPDMVQIHDLFGECGSLARFDSG